MLILVLLLSASFVAARVQAENPLPSLAATAHAPSAEQQVAGPAGTDAPAAHELSPGDAREDLTVFFSIGIVIDILLLTLFAVWAVGQWRKPRK